MQQHVCFPVQYRQNSGRMQHMVHTVVSCTWQWVGQLVLIYYWFMANPNSTGLKNSGSETVKCVKKKKKKINRCQSQEKD